MDSIPQKPCTRCGVLYPATTEFFPPSKTNKSGLVSWCRSCVREYQKTPHAKAVRNAFLDKPEQVEKRQAYVAREDVKRRRAERQRNRYHEDSEFAEDKRKRSREYSKSERGAETRRAWRKEYLLRPGVRERVRSQQRAYERNPANKIKIRDHKRQYHQTEQGKAKVKGYSLNRRARKTALPNTLTSEQWLRAIGYFGGCCAVCNKQLTDLFGERTVGADHWIPLSDPRPDNPGTVATNIVPLCHGVGGCNNSKSDRDPIEWLTEKFGKRKAAQILKRINAYFEWVRAQDDNEGSLG